jgi:glutamate--cysteine ligase
MVIELPADTTVTTPTGLSETDAEQLIGAICFKTGPPGTTGVELEWLVRNARDSSLSVPFDTISQILRSLQQPGALPGGGLLTLEPGGQVELSSAPAKDLTDCVAAASGDLAIVREAFAKAGLQLTGHGIDPLRPPRRLLDLPRYAAMEQFFDRRGHWGRLMMCSTASVQVCVDAGLDGPGPSGYAYRWRLLHALGPVLVAAFANSPLRRGKPTGWKCTRQLVWSRLDPGRTLAPPGAEPWAPADGQAGQDIRSRWTSYAMDADVLCLRGDDGQPWTVPAGLTLRDWLRQPDTACDGRPPTAGDVSYHLSTLFPPVRPRGHLELRMIDAQPGDGWIVPAAVVSALADDPLAAEAAMAAAEPVWHRCVPPPRQPWHPGASRVWQDSPWLRAARHGPADPVLGCAVRQCFEAAGAALDRSGAAEPIRNAVADFAQRYADRGRCPADDVLATFQTTAGG